jgi:hypothetical protein
MVDSVRAGYLAGAGLLCTWFVLGACTGQIAQPGSHSDLEIAQHAGGPKAAKSPGPGDSVPAADGGAADASAAMSCDTPAAALTPLQRLTRKQYVSSVRDVFAVAADPEAIPEDEKVGAFSGNTVAPVGELGVEQYMVAAEGVARTAMAQLPTLVSCDWSASNRTACASEFVERIGRRLYRRPLLAAESDSYTALFAATVSASSSQDALRQVVQTMLQSPSFLYHVELSEVPPGSGEVVALDPYELASRLAFFLTGSTPDDALLDAANAGGLDSEAGLTQQVSRLLGDPRAKDAIETFHFEWLELDDLARLQKDTSVYPGFDSTYLTAMQNETAHFVDYVILQGDAKLSTLLTAPFSFPEGPLFDVYGVQAQAGRDVDAPVMLDASQRAGLLTQPAFLAVHAHLNQSGPVQRGKAVIRNVLCEALGDPPPNVDTTPPDPSPTATTRQRLAEHEKNPSCSGCHVRIDGIGLGFEQFDGIGRFRSSEAGQTIDATGTLVGTRDLDGTFDGAVDLANKL